MQIGDGALISGIARWLKAACPTTRIIGVCESPARVIALDDEVVLVDDDDLRAGQRLIQQTLNLQVEPAGAAGVAALVRHGTRLEPGRTAVLLTGAAPNEPPP